MAEENKTIIKLTSFATLQTLKSLLITRVDWFSKANTLELADPCAWGRGRNSKCLVFGQAIFQASPLCPRLPPATQASCSMQCQINTRYQFQLAR